MTEPNPETSRLREARPKDGMEASELVRSLGLTMPETPAAIEAYWRRLWVDNPAIPTEGQKPPLGWVLEKNNRMVGFFCNVPLLYYFGKRRVTVSVASQWGLNKSHRRKIHQLAGAYFEQGHVDILMATTANKSAGRIFEHYGADRIPQADYDRALYWIIDSGGFLGAALKRKKTPPLLTSFLKAVAGPLVWTAQTMGWRRPTGQETNVELIGANEIDDRFNDLWVRKRDEAQRLLACRTADCLRWHFSGTQHEKGTRVLTHGRERLRGYGVVMREDANEIGLKRLRIADLFVENNDPAVVNDLLSAAFAYGWSQGCHVLEWVGMTADMRQTAMQHNPLVRTLPTWPLFYKVADDDLKASLVTPDAWYITPYDGDTTLA